MGEDFKILLQAVLDSSHIGESDIKEVQKVLSKYHLKLSAELNQAELLKTIKQVVPQLEKELKKITGVDIKISDNAILNSIKQVGIEADKAANKVKNIQLKIDTGEYDSKVTDLRAKLEQFGSANNAARSAVEQLDIVYRNFANANDGNEKIEAAKQLEVAIKKATNSHRNLNAEYAKTSQIDSLAQKYQAFYDKNTAAHGKWGAQLKANLAQLTSGMSLTKAQADKLEKELIDIQNAARQTGKLGLSWTDKLKQGMASFSQWTSATAIVTKGIQLGKEGVQFVRELDDALTDVVYTSDITKSQLENLGNSSVKMAKDLKASTANVLEAVKIYSTANATADDILRKSKPAVMLSNVSGMSGSESAKTIQTSLNQFELEDTEEGLLDIVDTLEYVSSQLNYDFTEGMKEITEGIEAAGSVAKNAGLDMQEYATMVGVAVEKTGQSGSTIGK